MIRNGQFLRDWKAFHSHCIWMSARPIHGVSYLSSWFTLKGVCRCCGEIWSKRTRVFEDDVFIENTRLVGGSKTQDLNLRADLVLNMSRGPPGQWFPETEYVSVEKSGIPPKIIYRSVKSYKVKLATLVEGDPKAPFSIASAPRCTAGPYSFSCIALLYPDPYLIMLCVKHVVIKYHFLNHWYDSIWDWTPVSRTIGEHSIH